MTDRDRLVVEAGVRTVDELLAPIQEGRRVVVETEFLGDVHEVVLRYDGTTYYCDTPTRLHKHDTVSEMRTCLENRGYARSSSSSAGESAPERDRRSESETSAGATDDTGPDRAG